MRKTVFFLTILIFASYGPFLRTSNPGGSPWIVRNDNRIQPHQPGQQDTTARINTTGDDNADQHNRRRQRKPTQQETTTRTNTTRPTQQKTTTQTNKRQRNTTGPTNQDTTTQTGQDQECRAVDCRAVDSSAVDSSSRRSSPANGPGPWEDRVQDSGLSKSQPQRAEGLEYLTRALVVLQWPRPWRGWRRVYPAPFMGPGAPTVPATAQGGREVGKPGAFYGPGSSRVPATALGGREVGKPGALCGPGISRVPATAPGREGGGMTRCHSARVCFLGLSWTIRTSRTAQGRPGLCARHRHHPWCYLEPLR